MFSYYGGWVCPNIYYLGHSGVVNFGGLRIGGVSGIYYPRDYRMGHYEKSPFTYEMIRSAYHYREFEIKKLMKVPKISFWLVLYMHNLLLILDQPAN